LIRVLVLLEILGKDMPLVMLESHLLLVLVHLEGSELALDGEHFPFGLGQLLKLELPLDLLGHGRFLLLENHFAFENRILVRKPVVFLSLNT